MKKRIGLALAAVLIVIIAASLWSWRLRPDSAAAALTVSGNIEVTEVPLAFKTAGRLDRRLVDEGAPVRRGQIVARLESADQQRLAAQAEANLAYAQAVLAELEAGSRAEDIAQAAAVLSQARQRLKALETGSRTQEIAVARAEAARAEASLAAAAAQLAQARADEDRYGALVEDGGVSRRDYELYRMRRQTAVSAEAEARARLQSARQQLNLVREGPRIEQIAEGRAAVHQAEASLARVRSGPRRETIDAARARVTAARESLQLTRQQLADTELAAPTDGIVLSKSAESGTFLAPGMPVVTLGDLDHPWLRAYINETVLGRVRLGQKVKVTTDAGAAAAAEGRVVFISSEAEFTPKTVQTFEERVKLMYRIRVDLPNPGHRFKPGMPADAVIELAP